MLDELVKAVRLHLSERLTSPLIGAFALSWSAWNYRLFVVIFSGESVEKKFQIIDCIIFPSVQVSMLRSLAFPLATALAYIFLYPYPAKWVYEFSRKKKREILEVRRRIEDETPLTIEDSRRIRSDLARAEQDFYAELDRKEREIERLKSQLAAQASHGQLAEIHRTSGEIEGSPNTSRIKGFSYSPHGRHGRNVLAETTHDVEIDEKLSFQADVPDGQKLHVVMRGPPSPSIGDGSAAWYFSIVGVKNWVSSKYQDNTSFGIQHFNAEEGGADMQLHFSRPGEIRIEVFEGDGRSATWVKTIYVSGKNGA